MAEPLLQTIAKVASVSENLHNLLQDFFGDSCFRFGGGNLIVKRLMQHFSACFCNKMITNFVFHSLMLMSWHCDCVKVAVAGAR